MTRPQDAATEALAEAAVGAIAMYIVGILSEPTMAQSTRELLRGDAVQKLAEALKRRGYVIRKARKSNG